MFITLQWNELPVQVHVLSSSKIKILFLSRWKMCVHIQANDFKTSPREGGGIIN